MQQSRLNIVFLIFVVMVKLNKINEYLLAIESSCDESAAAIMSLDGQVISNIIYSSVLSHVSFGGIVPEFASRHQLHRIPLVVEEAFYQAKIKKKQIVAVAVTVGPGLIGSLLIGVQFAKGFALANDSKFIGIHHIEGHIMASQNDKIDEPFIAMIASGGHSALYLSRNQKLIILGETRDDAAGEAFDKIARMLGLTYPGGPKLEKHAKTGNSFKYKFPIAFNKSKTLDYSFSGLKTAVFFLIQKVVKKNGILDVKERNNICASAQRAIVLALLNKAFLACKQKKINRLVFGGGVVANSFLRNAAKKRAELESIYIHIPKVELCTDNAVMIALAALKRIKKGQSSSFSISVFPKISIEDMYSLFWKNNGS